MYTYMNGDIRIKVMAKILKKCDLILVCDLTFKKRVFYFIIIRRIIFF